MNTSPRLALNRPLQALRSIPVALPLPARPSALLVLALLFVSTTLTPTARADTYFIDTFTDSHIDHSRWETNKPHSNSQIYSGVPNLALNNSGQLLTKDSFTTPYEVLFRFAFTGNVYDSFKIALRTDGASSNPSGEFDSGIFASFRITADPGAPEGISDNVSIYAGSHPAAPTLLGLTTSPLHLYNFNEVRITDFGTSIDLYLNDFNTPLLSVSTPTSFGSQIGFYNREGVGTISAGSQVQMNYFAVMAYDENVIPAFTPPPPPPPPPPTHTVPDAGSSLGLTLAGLAGLVAFKRVRRRDVLT